MHTGTFKSRSDVIHKNVYKLVDETGLDLHFYVGNETFGQGQNLNELLYSLLL